MTWTSGAELAHGCGTVMASRAELAGSWPPPLPGADVNNGAWHMITLSTFPNDTSQQGGLLLLGLGPLLLLCCCLWAVSFHFGRTSPAADACGKFFSFGGSHVCPTFWQGNRPCRLPCTTLEYSPLHPVRRAIPLVRTWPPPCCAAPADGYILYVDGQLASAVSNTSVSPTGAPVEVTGGRPAQLTDNIYLCARSDLDSERWA